MIVAEFGWQYPQEAERRICTNVQKVPAAATVRSRAGEDPPAEEGTGIGDQETQQKETAADTGPGETTGTRGGFTLNHFELLDISMCEKREGVEEIMYLVRGKLLAQESYFGLILLPLWTEIMIAIVSEFVAITLLDATVIREEKRDAKLELLKQ